MSIKPLSKNTVDNIINKYGKPSLFFGTKVLDKVNKSGNLEKAEVDFMEPKQKEFYEQWYEMVHTNYKSGNSCAICISCFTYIKRGKMVLFLY